MLLEIIYRHDACDVTLSVYPHRASLKYMPDRGGNRTYDIWNTSPMLCQLSYAVSSVQVCEISEQNPVPSISMYLIIIMIFSVHYTNTEKIMIIIRYIDIEGTRICSEISHTRTDQTA